MRKKSKRNLEAIKPLPKNAQWHPEKEKIIYKDPAYFDKKGGYHISYLENPESVYYYYGKNILKLIGRHVKHQDYDMFLKDYAHDPRVQEYLKEIQFFIETTQHNKQQIYLYKKSERWWRKFKKES